MFALVIYCIQICQIDTEPSEPSETNDTSQTSDVQDSESGITNLQFKTSLCPLIAQKSPANHKDCPDWLVQEDGQKVTYVGTALTAAKQRMTFFDQTVRTLYVLSA